MKKAVSALLALVFAVCLCAPAFASQPAAPFSFAVNPCGGAEDAPDTIQWALQDGAYYLYLPGGADPEAAVAYFDAAGEVFLDGEPVVSGGACAAVFVPGAHTLTAADGAHPFTTVVGSDIPAVFLATESGSMDYIHADKENKEAGSIRILEHGAVTLDSALKQIKGRGNATWSYEKKPYNIKFKNKTAVLGMPKAKKWTLLAGHLQDPSQMKNAAAFTLGAALGLAETSQFRHVELYANGAYLGLYLICESVEIAENRLDIRDLEKENENANPGIEDLGALPLMGVRAGYEPGSLKWTELPNSPEDITGGYLLEVDYLYRYHAEASGFISALGLPVVIKSPEFASRAEVGYISALWNAAEEALFSENGRNAAGRHFTELFDLPSLALCYLAEEITKDVDTGITSFYFYKKAGDEKLYAGPLWDFDHALGSNTTIGDRLTVFEPETWYANQLYRNSIDTACGCFATVFSRCWRFAAFREAVRQAWDETGADALAQTRAAVSAMRGASDASAVMNHVRWNTYGTRDAAAAAVAYEGSADALAGFLAARDTALNKGFSPDGASVSYDPNGGAGKTVYDPAIYTVGDTAAAKACGTLTREGFTFNGWNTRADGSGAELAPGASFTVTDGCTVLYAQWQPIPAPEEPAAEPDSPQPQRSIWQRILDFFRRVIAFVRGLFGG